MGYSFLGAEELCFLRRLVPLSACIFSGLKSQKKDTASIGARREV